MRRRLPDGFGGNSLAGLVWQLACKVLICGILEDSSANDDNIHIQYGFLVV